MHVQGSAILGGELVDWLKDGSDFFTTKPLESGWTQIFSSFFFKNTSVQPLKHHTQETPFGGSKVISSTNLATSGRCFLFGRFVSGKPTLSLFYSSERPNL